jgi:hypothetical protein
VLTREPVWSTLITMTLLSTVAVILLPRQFHVTVVENHSESEIRRAAWLFPIYLVAINLFVIPIAIAGLLTFAPGSVDSDMFVLALPLSNGSEILALVAFVGGLSAATAMVIVETVALAIMASNTSSCRQRSGARRLLRAAGMSAGSCSVRRIAIFVILVLAYMYYRLPAMRSSRRSGCYRCGVAPACARIPGGPVWRDGSGARCAAGMSANSGGSTRCRCRALGRRLVSKDILPGPSASCGCARSICWSCRPRTALWSLCST